MSIKGEGCELTAASACLLVLSSPGVGTELQPQGGVLIFGQLGKFKQHGNKSKCPGQSDRTMKRRVGEEMSMLVRPNSSHTEGPVYSGRGDQTVICVKITPEGSGPEIISSQGKVLN